MVFGLLIPGRSRRGVRPCFGQPAIRSLDYKKGRCERQGVEGIEEAIYLPCPCPCLFHSPCPCALRSDFGTLLCFFLGSYDAVFYHVGSAKIYQLSYTPSACRDGGAEQASPSLTQLQLNSYLLSNKRLVC